MKKFGIMLLCATIACVSVIFSYYMTKKTELPDTLTTEAVYGLALESGYVGTLADFINDFKGTVGDDGRGIVSAEINESGHLILTYTDYTTVDAGQVSVGELNITDGISGKALNKVLTSSVSIFCRYDDGTYSSGGGVIYSLDKTTGTAYIITAYHVVFDDTADAVFDKADISVYLYGLEYPHYAIGAEYVGGSASYDVAVLKITDSAVIKSGAVTSAVLGDSELISVLDTVIAVGNPCGNGISATRGTVNIESENRYINLGASAGTVFMRVIRTDASVNKGNSGGGLYDADGRLIGIVTAKNFDEGVDNVAYAIPVNVIKYLSDNIMHYCDGSAETCGRVMKLGISLEVKSVSLIYDETADKTVKREEVAIKEITQGSYAERAGLKIGDIVKCVTVNGKEHTITRVYQAPEATLSARSGDSLVYKVIRDGAEIEIIMTVPTELSKIQ